MRKAENPVSASCGVAVQLCWSYDAVNEFIGLQGADQLSEDKNVEGNSMFFLVVYKLEDREYMKDLNWSGVFEGYELADTVEAGPLGEMSGKPLWSVLIFSHF